MKTNTESAFKPPALIEFCNDGSRAEFIIEPATPKGMYVYKYYHSNYPDSKLPGTTIRMDQEQIEKLFRNYGLKTLTEK